jgi:hypothetical protein
MDGKRTLALIIALAAALWLILCMQSCYTPKKAERKLAKALDKQPATVAVFTRKAFPCITKGSDTVYNTNYDTTIVVEVQCPDSTKATEYFTVHDTAFFNNVIIRKVPVTVTLPARTITKYIEDSAKIFTMTNIANRLQSEKDDLQKRLNRSDKTKMWLWWVVIIAALLVALRFVYGFYTKNIFTKL